ncbi:recombinase family protein [Metaclostridioides mangenotii]|uniref:recombinase family protein n=1 Tax=Metaclostridioides mangenotii TaxID=1540 RepID=UPI0028E643D0|nr:recombinase family protein [Clostridioides mangenotii]
MNVAIYLRKSRADLEAEKNGEFETLDRHKSTLLNIAREKNLNIVEIKEELVSGESLVNRPKMMELLNEVKNGLFDAVLVMDIDRLGRGNMQDQGLILDTFKESNTKIITPRKIYDLSNEFDEEYSEFEAFMARKELKLITRRMQRGRIKSIEEGKFVATNPPYGYKIEYQNKDRYLVVDDEKSEIVKIIYNLYSDGNGANKIASYLNSLGYKTTTGRTFYDKLIRDIIKNKVYCGYISWNTTKRKGSKSSKTEKDSWIIAKGIHEPIVSEDLWNKCNSIRSKRSISSTPNNVLTNPLAGIVKCSLCGYTLVAKSSTSKQKDGTNIYTKYMVCSNCLNRSTKLDILEKTIIESLERWLVGYKIEISENDIKNNNSTTIKDYNKMLSNLEKELDELAKQKDGLHDFLEKRIYDIDTYLNRSKNVSDRIDTINDSIKHIKNEINKETEKNQAKVKFLPSLEYLLDNYAISTIEEKNKLLKTVLDRVTYIKNHKKRDEYDFDIVLYPKLPYQ